MPCTIERMYERLEDREASRHSLKLPDARSMIARTMAVSVGTLTNLRLGRLKRREHLEGKIKSALIKSLEAEIATLHHELHLLRQGGAAPDSDEVLEAEALLARAKELIRG